MSEEPPTNEVNGYYVTEFEGEVYRYSPKSLRLVAGNREGSLEAVKFLGVPVESACLHRYWLYRCDCGKYISRIPSNLKRNKSNRCLDCSNNRQSHAWMGHGEIPKDVFNTIRHGAIARELDFSITIEEIWELYERQNRCCALTGWPIIFNNRYKEKKLKTASLDRIDSTRGYFLDNVQWVHRDVNKLKKNLGNDYFIELCKAIADCSRRTEGEGNVSPSMDHFIQ